MANPLVTIKDLQKIDAIASNKFSSTEALMDSISSPFDGGRTAKIMDCIRYARHKSGEVIYKWYPNNEFCQDNFIAPLPMEYYESMNMGKWITKVQCNSDRLILTFDPKEVPCSLEQLNDIHFYWAGVKGLYQPQLHNWIFQANIENFTLFSPNIMTSHNLQAFITVTEYAM